jgi:uncharacterized protein YuzE
MRLTYDKSVNAAYIYLVDNILPGGVSKTYSCDPTEVGGMINLDFDKTGQLIGLEVLDASKKLPEELLSKAELIG